MDKQKIFISHSAKDIDVIESFVENILRLGLDIPAERIFCTSMEGQGILSGQYIPDQLKKEILNSSIALLFISNNYKTSEVCLSEMGAVWVSFEKEDMILLLLPDIDFDKIGFLDLGRLSLKINDRSNVLKLIQDKKHQLNPSFNLEKLHAHLEKFLNKIELLFKNEKLEKPIELSDDAIECKRCFEENLYPFDIIIRQVIPALNDGIYEITDVQLQNKLLDKLSKSTFLKTLWYKKAEGDFYVEKIRKLPSGNWLVSEFGWEIKISSLWVSKDVENQYEFILIHSNALAPFKIESDVGGESYNVGILNDGTIVSENERLNGYAIINNETVNLDNYGVEPRYRDSKSHWVFFVTDYHKAGYNPDETIDFCKKLDSGEIEVNADNIHNFLWRLRNHPTIIQWR